MYNRNISPFSHHSLTFGGTERFRVQRRIGAGGMGVVYEAYDNERQSLVALKTLPELNPGRLYLFKQEFRSLCRVSHSNLVTLHELFSEGDRWYFTMELIDGVGFLSYVRSESEKSEEETQTYSGANLPERILSGGCDYFKLRAALRQLTEGVAALHAEGKLHRDLKPSNVVVGRDGRVVVLDFGLVTEIDVGAAETVNKGRLAGTLSYMSPEQCAGGQLSAASDWYSVGVMMYQAITGKLPFSGTYLKVVMDKQSTEVSTTSALAPDVPPELDRLCLSLLRLNPAERSGAAEILASLGTAPPIEPAAGMAPQPVGEPAQFVGREAELAALEAALDHCREGHTVTVRLHGKSGIGKSSLANYFLNRAAGRGQTVVLAGRCYEQERVPYKVLDSVVDSLSRHLARLTSRESSGLIPRDITALMQVFPVLGRAEIVARAPGRTQDGVDQRELRRRAFAALRELLTRMGDREDLVLFIDDLQWGDAESAQLLKDVLLSPDGPRLLLICAYRSEYAARSECLQTLFPQDGAAALPQVREIALEPLSMEDARLLASRLLNTSVESKRAANIARESQGSPYFLQELTRRAKADGPPDEAGSVLTLDSAIAARVGALPPELRRLLEIVCVPGQPLRQGDIYRAAGLATRDLKALVYLRNNYLVRSTGPSDRDEVEAYHDRIRETVVAHLAPETRAGYHHSLAVTLESSEDADAEAIAAHFEAAGEPESAGLYYGRAGEKAADALAFDHAAGLLRRALELRPVTGQERVRLELRLAETLANAGHAAEAAHLYEEAAQSTAEEQRQDLEWKAAYYFAISGRIDEGKAIFARILNQVGLKLPGSIGEAMRSWAWWRLQLAVRGLKVKPRAEAQVPKLVLRRADLAWAAATGLTMVDLFSAVAFSTRTLLLALETGDPFRVTRAILLEAMGRPFSEQGRRSARKLIERARPFIERSGSAYLQGFQHLALAATYYTSGRWPDSLAEAEQAERIFDGERRTAWWELAASRNTVLWCHQMLGDTALLAERSDAWLADARGRGDRFSESTIGVFVEPLRRIAEDRPQEALEILEESLALCPPSLLNQRSLAALARGYIHLYLGHGLQAYEAIQSQWPELRRSYALRNDIMRISALELRLRAALLAMLQAPEPGPFVASASRDVRLLEKERLVYAAPCVAKGRACLAAFRGDRETAIRELERTAGLCDRLSLQPPADAVRRALGLLVGSERGAALVRDADASLLARGFRNPARYSGMHVPLFTSAGLTSGGLTSGGLTSGAALERRREAS